MESLPMPAGAALLVVGHPGHELRVHGWLETARPIVMVITDGSGQTGAARLPSTAAVIERAGGQVGPVFGRITDVEVYRALLAQDWGLFIGMAEEVAAAIGRHRITVVAADDAEGYNPTHDVCRLMVDAAVALARTRCSHPIVNLAFTLMTHPDRIVHGDRAEVSRIQLDDAALRRKLDAALGYPEMAGEVAAARRAWGDEAFRAETFRRVPAGEMSAPPDQPPAYERHGAQRVQAGTYTEVIRYALHVQPLAGALAARAQRCDP